MKFLTSVRTTVVLLIVIAALAVVGTLIPQGLTQEQYARLYGPGTIKAFRVFGLFNVYQSWWFLGTLSLLALNVIFCSLRRLPFPCSHPRRWGVYTVHVSLLVIIAGGLVTGLFGFKGYMEVEEGKASSLVLSRGRAFGLPFEVFCEDFRLTRWPDGTPKEYLSVLLFRGPEGERRAEVRVNHPVKHRGLTFYQSSYGQKLEAELEVELYGERKKVVLEPGRVVDLGGLKLGLMRLSPDPLGGMRAFLVLFLDQPRGFWLGEGEGMAMEDVRLRLARVMEREWTGLQVSHDPGAPVVFVGAGLFVAGLIITFSGRARRGDEGR